MKKNTRHIHIQGQVQGVGFRPFIYQLAHKFKLNGWVNNTGDGVHIGLNADEEVAKNFYHEVISNAPNLSHITSHSIKEISPVDYKDFQIIKSGSEENPFLLISPDFAMCEECRKEILDKNNRRYNYAFTTCTQCGPRYSIIKQQPYDRENTAMDVLKMCDKCNEEYDNPLNRRHFSQTNSCPDCAVRMKLFDNKKKIIEKDQNIIIAKICELWNDGKIVAIKGIGGYLLTCDATNEKAISRLRFRKHRPAKPFAMMFHDITLIENEANISEQEKIELQSSAAPVVLLQRKENAHSRLALKEIAPQLSRIGVMLPYTPLYKLLLYHFKKPIVATSGNISNASIVYEDKIALEELIVIADHILIHNREIIGSQDDSVIQYSRFLNQRIMLRRARGFSPSYLNKNLLPADKTILATGAMMKSSFTLLHHHNIHISQYLGDTNNYDAQKNFEKNLNQFLKLFNTKPEVILADKHPGYFTTQLAKRLSAEQKVPLIKIQHHEAHFASVLGEHNLIDEKEPVLGVIWDGTGFGNDGQIWGGEFFIYHQHKFVRTNHFQYFNHFLGDKMAMEPRLSAFSLCHEMQEASAILKPKFSSAEWNNYHQLIKKNELKTSGTGRIFDAVASLLGLVDKTSFEGEAAMLVEEEAQRYFKKELNIPAEWLQEMKPVNLLSPQYLIKEVIKKILEGKNKSEIAAWFHVQLVLAIQKVIAANLTGKQDLSGLQGHKICFSGGVFQNGLLIDLVIKILGKKYEVYINKDLSPNDENISFGQLICHTIMNTKASIN